MGYMDFKSPILEKVFKRFKWTRNNSIQIFEHAGKSGILEYALKPSPKSKYTFQPITFQFQCIATTANAYQRILTNNSNVQFGIFVEDGEVTSKKDLNKEKIFKILKNQLTELEELFKNYDEKQALENIDNILAISNHEYLHQGELILMFREADAELPERFAKAWALG